MVAHNDDGSVGVEFGMGSGGDFAHGHEERIGEACGLVLPGLADVQQKGLIGLLALLGKGFGSDFEF